MIIYVNSKLKKILLILLFLIFSIIIKSEKLSSISGISKLKNFTKLQSIESEKILDFDTQVVLNNNLAYEKENNKLFTGIAIQKIKNNIRSINFYENGNLISYYKYFLDGDIENLKEFDKNKNQVITQKYDKNKKIILQKIYENEFLILENHYINGKLTIEYKAENKENGKFIYYNSKKKISEMEILQANQNGQILQIPQVVRIFRKNGKLEREYIFKNGSLENQKQKIYYPNGNLKHVAIAANNNMQELLIKELYEEYYKNGNKAMKCNEVSNGRVWDCEYYNQNGNLKSKEQVFKDFYQSFAVKQSNSSPSFQENMEDLKNSGKGILNVFFMILDGILHSN